MNPIQNSSLSIGKNYPTTTGRLKQVIGSSPIVTTKIALLGDSTLDNGYWVQKNVPYDQKTHTVTHQTAKALASTASADTYSVGNFAVDGATTRDLLKNCHLNKVLPTDSDHPSDSVCQLDAVAEWAPDVIVLSVAGNNYREALMGALMRQLTYSQLLLRTTPEKARHNIQDSFNQVKKNY